MKWGKFSKPFTFTEQELLVHDSIFDKVERIAMNNAIKRSVLTGVSTSKYNTSYVGDFLTHVQRGIDPGTTIGPVDPRDEKIKYLEQEVSSLKKDMDFMYDKFEQVKKELIEMIRVNTALQEKHVRGGYWEENS